MQSQTKTESKATKPEDTKPQETKPEKTEPKEPPKKNFFLPAIISFSSNSEQVVLGDVNKHGDRGVQVALTNKHTGTDAPWVGYRIKLERDKSTVHLYDDEKYHTVLFKYHRGQYAIKYHKATEAQKLIFLEIAPDSPGVKKACQNDKLIIVQFFLDGKEGPEIHGVGSSFVGANDRVNAVYKHLSSIPSCQMVELYLFEYTALLAQLDWIIPNQASRTDPLLHYYKISKSGQPQGCVQWNALRPRDLTMTKAFDRRIGCHNFEDFTVLYGNSEAYEAQHSFELSRELRATKVTMSVFAPRGSSGDYYVVSISVPGWHRFQHVLMPFDELRICFEPPPTIKPQSEKAKGEKDPKDNAPGWSGRVMEDNALFQDAPLTALIRRPVEGSPLWDMEMPSVDDVEQRMPTRDVYIKTFPSALTVKARLKAIDKHTSSKNQSTGFDRKRRLLVGRDLSVDHTVDLLHNIPQAKIAELTAGLNTSQIQCIHTHCRQVPNGLNLIHGPFGSGKTVLVKMLCELQALRVPKSKTFIACSSNSACDAVVPKFMSTNSKLMIVRAHGMSLERESLLHEYHVKRNGKLREADPLPEDYETPVVVQKIQQEVSTEDAETIEEGTIEEGVHPDDPDHGSHPKETDAPAPSPDDAVVDDDWGTPNLDINRYGGEALRGEEDDIVDFMSDEMMLQADLQIMKLCENAYSSRVSPPDTRMVSIDVSIHTWILKFAGIINSEWSMKPNRIQESQGMQDPWAGFRYLYSKTNEQHLNEKERLELKRGMAELANTVLRAADVIIATAVQGELDLLKDIKFDQVIMDEVSVATMGELLCCWRDLEVLTLIGDSRQLPTTVLTTPEENPFSNIQSFGPFQRWSLLGVPVFLLKEVMRMTAGLEAIANDLFYDGKLVRGPGTELDNPQREMSRRLQPVFRKMFPKLTNEPDGLVYPIFCDIRGKCVMEQGGTSRVNFHNIAFIVDAVQTLLSVPYLELKASDFGIACPYSAQRREMRKALYKADIKGVSTFNVEVGTAGFWQEKESEIMIVDLVRAGNDHGDLGFLGKKERLNVLLTRQRQHLFVVGDATCCDADLAAEEYEAAAAELIDDPKEASDKKNEEPKGRKNMWVMRVLKWFNENGRVHIVDMAELKQNLVTFDVEEEEEVDVDVLAGGWGNAPKEQDSGKQGEGGVAVDAKDEIGKEESGESDDEWEDAPEEIGKEESGDRDGEWGDEADESGSGGLAGQIDNKGTAADWQ